MKTTYSPRVNTELFPESWDYAARLLRTAKRSRLMEAILDPVAHLIFLAEGLFITWGLLYSHVDFPVLQDFLRGYPAFTNAWGRFSREVLHCFPMPEKIPPFLWELLISLILALAVPMAVCLLLAGLIRLLCRPGYVSLPQGDPGDQAAKLFSLVRKIQRLRIKPRVQASGASTTVFLLVTFAIGGYIFVEYVGAPSPDMNLMLIPTIFSAIAVGLFLAYGAADYLLMVVLKKLYHYDFPKEFVEETKAYVLQTLPPQEAEALLSLPMKPRSLPARFLDWAKKVIPCPKFLETLLDNPQGFPCPVTRENFPDAWKWASRKLYWAKKKWALKRLTSLILYPYFTILLFLMVYGALCDLKKPLFIQFFGQWSLLDGFWEKIRPLLYQDLTAAQLPARQAELLYLVPLAATVLLGLLVLLLYHPRARKPSETEQTQAVQLIETLREASAAAKSRTVKMAGTCHTAFAALGIFALAAFLLYCLGDPAATDLFREQLSSSIGYVLLSVFAFTIGYRLVRLPMEFMLWLLTCCHIPRRVLPEAEKWLETFEEKTE